jgi:formylglycine-generating enzyme required for sulfatase activity
LPFSRAGDAAASTASPQIIDIQFLHGIDDRMVHLVVESEDGLASRFTVTEPKADGMTLYGVQGTWGISDQVNLFRQSLAGGWGWQQVDHQDLGSVMMLVAFDPADKAVQEADPTTYPQGFGSYQVSGPEYDYFVGRYEVTNEEFARFLNSAQAHPDTTLGRFMFFGEDGRAWFNPLGEEDTPSDFDLFDVFDSFLAYDATAPAGSRYSVTPGFARYPVAGVSWYGALKYCNWLTVDSGLGESERCYREGFNPEDWRPVTATNWPSFTDAQRETWVNEFSGYRLPMLHVGFTVTSAYNEYRKAAGWTGTGLSEYGFGRSSINRRSANYFMSGDPFNGGASPVGFYNGVNRNRFLPTKPNENMHGLYDMCGNVNEWLNDVYLSPGLRAFAGGSFLAPSTECKVQQPHSGTPRVTLGDLGFRIASGPSTDIGTNVNETISLSITPAGTVEVAVPNQVLFAGLGGTGSNAWSVADAALGALNATTGMVVRYTTTSGLGTQSVVVSDGLTALTTTVVQVEPPAPPDPPSGELPPAPPGM